MTDDRTLLCAYAKLGSEAAFSELVGRHLDFVYGTALRVLGGDEHMAKDVSQSVFVDLARKASTLVNRSILTGWLYTSTCFAAAKAVRSERRRQAREQEAHTMQEQCQTVSPEADWDRFRPVLDALMLELKEPDREALLLRFFQKCSFTEVGSKFGLGENAARMRVERALERLRDLMTRRGITSTAATLTALLTNQTIIAAPVGLAASITSASAAGAAAISGASTSALMALGNAKIVIVGVLIVAGLMTPAVVQYHHNTRLKGEIAGLRAQLAERFSGPQTNPSSDDTGELARLRSEHAELLRLRGRVGTLLQQTAEGQRAQPSSNEPKRSNAIESEWAGGDEKDRALLSKSPEIPMLPASSWANLGFATPVSSIQTLNWALLNRDTNAFASAMMWDAQVMAQAGVLFAALPQSVKARYGSLDGLILDWVLGHSPVTDSYRVLSQTEQGVDDVTLVEQHQYVGGQVRENPVHYHRDESGSWRQIIPADQMPKLEAMINDLAGAPPAGWDR
jgi:RNA polymerase sigma factor (sigma-70 family)